MKKFLLSENGLNKINSEIVNESYSNKVELVKRYLDNNFMRATFEKDGVNVGIFVKLSNGIPTSKSYWKNDIIDILDERFNNIISDKEERYKFLNQLTDDWYNNKITKYGNLSTYSY